MKFKIGTKVYTAVSFLKPTIRDYLKLGNETEAMGRRWTQNDVFELEQRVAAHKIDPENPRSHPEIGELIMFTLWARFAVDGDPDPFDKAIDVSMEDFEFVVEPQDHKEAADPTTARADSVRAVKRPAAKPHS